METVLHDADRIDWSHPFWSKVAPEALSGCWLWMGTYFVGNHNGGPYGHVSFNGKTRRAHRVAVELTSGSIPDGMFACHRCDVTLCVNPAHLFVGTPGDNVRDCVAKGRHPNKQFTHCKLGHELSGGNLRPNKYGWRDCHQCRLINQRAVRRRKRIDAQR